MGLNTGGQIGQVGKVGPRWNQGGTKVGLKTGGQIRQVLMVGGGKHIMVGGKVRSGITE